MHGKFSRSREHKTSFIFSLLFTRNAGDLFEVVLAGLSTIINSGSTVSAGIDAAFVEVEIPGELRLFVSKIQPVPVLN